MTDQSQSKNCTCCTCGYTWERGYDGSHSCVENLSARLAIAEKELAACKRDKVRLDYLDYLNRCLNARSGTLYGWRLILSHNVRRLAADFPRGIDLNDANAVGCYPTGLLSVRAVIDQNIVEIGTDVDAEAAAAVDRMLAAEMKKHSASWMWSGCLMRCRECWRAIHYERRHTPLEHAPGCRTHGAYPWEILKAVASNF